MIKNFTTTFEWLRLRKDFMLNMDRIQRKMAVQFNTYERDLELSNCYNSIVNDIKKFLGVKYAFLVVSGTQSLIVSLKSLGIGNGDEVITTVYTGIPTVNAIRLVGAEPIFVDIKKDTWNIDENKIEEKITNKTKVIMPVDIFGNPCNYDKILEIAKKYDIPVIEDACHAFTAIYHKKHICNVGCDIACTSFGSEKAFGTLGQGGLICTNNENLAKKVEALLNYGSLDEKEDCICAGLNGNFDIMGMVYLFVKMRLLNYNLDYRNKVVSIYKQMKNVTWQKQEPNAISAWCKPQIIFKDEKLKNIASDIFELNYFFSRDICDIKMYCSERESTPISNQISHKTVSLPIYSFMNLEELKNAVNLYNQKVSIYD